MKASAKACTPIASIVNGKDKDKSNNKNKNNNNKSGTKKEIERRGRELEANAKLLEKEEAERKRNEELLFKEQELIRLKKEKDELEERNKLILQSPILQDELDLAAEGQNDELAIEIMEKYKYINGRYPYATLFFEIPNAFSLYLSLNGIDANVITDIKTYLYSYIRDDYDYCSEHWDLFKTRLREIDDLECELFVDKVGSSKVLIDCYHLGYIDHRLTHSIITMQRFVRYYNSCGSDDISNNTISNNNDINNSILLSRALKHISYTSGYSNVKSFSEIDYNHSDYDSECVSIVNWYSQCVPEFIHMFIRQTLDSSNIRFYYSGVHDFIFETNNSTSNILSPDDNILNTNNLMYIMNEKKLSLVRRLNLDDCDNASKVMMLLSYYARGNLTVLRNNDRDKLKYTHMKINNYSRELYSDELLKYPIHVLKDIASVILKTTSKYGLDIIKKFSIVDIDYINDKLVRKWFLDIVHDEYEDLVKHTKVSASRLMKFVELNIKSKSASKICRRRLKHYQKILLKKKQPMYNKIDFTSISTSSVMI